MHRENERGGCKRETRGGMAKRTKDESRIEHTFSLDLHDDREFYQGCMAHRLAAGVVLEASARMFPVCSRVAQWPAIFARARAAFG